LANSVKFMTAMILAISQLSSPHQAVAAPAIAPNPEGARIDPDFRCIMPLARAAIWQEQKAEPAYSSLPPLGDRVDAYFAEVGNHLMDSYGLSRADIDALSKPEFQAGADVMRKEVPGTVDPLVQGCIGRMAAMESKRAVPSPGRCNAMAQQSSAAGMVAGLGGGQTVDPAAGAIMGLPGMMAWLTMSRRAKAQLRAQGLTDRQIDAQFERERKALEREIKDNRKSGRLLVYDKAACNRLLRAPVAGSEPSPPKTD
jgi:hypothetical protein